MDTKKVDGKVYKVKLIDRLLDVLDSFTFENREMRLNEVSKKTGLNKTTAKRILSNLTQRKYLQQDPISKKYRLGLRLFELGSIVFSSFSVQKAADRWMDYLRKETGSTVLLGTIMEDQLVYINKKEGNQMIRISSEIGWRRPLNYGMLGMVLLAYQDTNYVEYILNEFPLKAYTSHSITDPEKFIKRLKQIRRQGYLIENEEAVKGVIGIAAPIKNTRSHTIAAMGIAIPIGQNTRPETAHALAKKVKKACDEISNSIGFRSA